jgi:hypothetical protein
VVTEGGGEVDGPGAAEHADDEVAQAGHVCGPVPVRTWEASSAKVTSRTWCRPFSRLALHRGPAGVVLPSTQHRSRLACSTVELVPCRQRRLAPVWSIPPS